MKLQRYSIMGALILIGTMVPLFLWPVDGEVYFQGKLVVSMVIVATVFVIHLPMILKTWQDKCVLGIMTLLWLLSTLSLFHSVDRSLSLWGIVIAPEGYVSVLMYIGAFFLGWRSSKLLSKADWLIIIEMGLLTGLVVSGVGILEFFYVIEPFPSYMGVIVPQDTNFTTIGNRNFVGTYTVILLTLSMGWTLISKRFRGIIYTLGILALMIVSQTRSAYVALVILLLGYAICGIKYEQTRKWSFAVIGTMIIFVVGGILILTNVLHDGRVLIRLQRLYLDLLDPLSQSAGSNRMEIWQNSMSFILDRVWIGSGPDTFGILYKEATGEIRFGYHKAHNHWLQLVVTFGVPYLLTYLVLIGVIIKGLYRSNSQLGKYLIILIIAYEFQGMFNISIGVSALMYWIILGVAVKESRNQKGCESQGTGTIYSQET